MEKETLKIPDFLQHKYIHAGDGWQDNKTELPRDKIFKSVVAIMRGNPFHVNHTAMLKGLCEKAIDAKINLGSSNRFDKKNPFKIEEREEMAKQVLKDYENFEVVRLPDFDNDDAWFDCLYNNNKPFTEILSNNQSDLKIYERYQKKPGYNGFDIISPTDIIDQENDMEYALGIWDKGIFVQAENPMYISGTFVRAAMVNDWNWQDFLDENVAEYIQKNGLINRVKKYCSDLKGITLADLEEDR